MFEVGKFYKQINNKHLKPAECLYVSPKGYAVLKFYDESEGWWRWSSSWKEVKPKKTRYSITYHFTDTYLKTIGIFFRVYNTPWYENSNDGDLDFLRNSPDKYVILSDRSEEFEV